MPPALVQESYSEAFPIAIDAHFNRTRSHPGDNKNESSMLSRLILAALLLCPPALLRAHHSFAAEFDGSKPVVLHGKVTRVDWMNPHVFLWMDVADARGNVTNWMLESAAPIYLEHLGWTRQSLKAGDTVTIRAFIAKDQPNAAKTDAVTLPNGRLVTTGRADDSAGNAGARNGASR